MWHLHETPEYSAEGTLDVARSNKRPWAKIGVDLCQHDGRQLLVAVDYYSNYPEVDRLRTITSMDIIKSLSIMFARYGVPDDVISDNDPQFSSSEFAQFAAEWNF